jgi:4-hydroxy-tetrahydrodipicolinate synthase
MKQLRGVITALVTPFDPAGRVDAAALRGAIDFQVNAGVGGLLVLGGSGEFTSLGDDERRAVMAIAVGHAAGRVPVVVGLLSPGTAHVTALGRHARRAGADALLVLPPFYIAPSPAGIREHFARVAGVGLPIVVYDNPARTGVTLGAETLAALAEIDEVVAVKECDRDLGRVAGKMRALAGRLAFLSGEDDLAFATLALGAAGGVWMAANLFPELFVALVRAVQAGRLEEARAIQYRLLPIIAATYVTNHPAPLKAALALAGRPAGPARPPLQPPTEAERDVMERALAIARRPGGGGSAGTRSGGRRARRP